MNQSRGSKPFTCCCKKPEPTCKQRRGKDCKLSKECGKGGKCGFFKKLDMCRNKHLREMMEKRYPKWQCERYIFECCCKKDIYCRNK